MQILHSGAQLDGAQRFPLEVPKGFERKKQVVHSRMLKNKNAYRRESQHFKNLQLN